MASRPFRTDPAPPGHARADHVLGVFRAAGWKVAPAPAGANAGDASLSKAQAKYAVVVKVASEGRRDRLVPLLSQAILEARSIAKSRPAAGRPLAVVAAPRIPPLVAEGLLAFAAAHAPGISVGVMDLLGLRAFAGPGLESLNGRPQAHGAGQAPTSEPRIHLFSDLNQWMLKVVLARHLHREDLLSGRAPKGDLKNASELATAAQVSVMSAFRFLRQLDHEGFLGEGRDMIRIVRLEALLKRWQAANLRPVPEVGVRWILPGSRQQLQRLMGVLGDRACLGLFAAARACRLGHVQGVPVHVLVERLPRDQWSRLGLTEVAPGHLPELVFRVPPAREAVFRGAVRADTFLVSDIIQTWLDVSSHPARGKEQADLIYRQVIRPMINRVKEARDHDA